MKIDLSGKVALVTGAAGNGLGRADCLALGRVGCKVAVFDVVDFSETINLLQKAGITAKGYKVDIADMEQVTKAVVQIESDLGSVDILVNNASILSTVGMFADIPVDKWNRDIAVNLIGSANVSRAVWAGMIKKNWGRVLFMSSFAGTHGSAGQSSYAATKAGVIGLAKSLALEGARYNITANAIAPGVMGSEMAMKGIRPDMLERMKKATAMRRFGTVEEIADTVTFLSSPQASYLTGQVLEVDGGMGLFVF